MDSRSKSKTKLFLQKTFKMLNEPSLARSITWSPSGFSFTISNPSNFSDDLPRFFKHKNLSSFIRQLYIYGFRKTSPYLLEFSHPLFNKERPDLLGSIRRKPPSSKPKQTTQSQLAEKITFLETLSDSTDTRVCFIKTQVDDLYRKTQNFIEDIVENTNKVTFFEQTLYALVNSFDHAVCSVQGLPI